MAFSNSLQAGVWGVDPELGVLGDYSTDPNLLHQRDTDLASAAVRLYAPTTYVDDNLQLSAIPDVRIGDSRGFASVTSDYAHLNLKGEYVTDLTSLTANAGLARDSSLAFDYLSSGDIGVRRDGANAGLNWSRHLTERIGFMTSVDAQRVLFGNTTGATLTSYEYGSIAPALSWQASERSQLGLAGSVSRYHSIDALDQTGLPFSTESRSANLQLGYVGQLSEQWSVRAIAGYSRALNHSSFSEAFTITFPFLAPIVIHIPVQVGSTQTGSLYNLNLAHQGDQLSLNATASRQLSPTGFAFLTTQDTYELKADYKVSERWSFGGDARYVRYQNPVVVNGTSTQSNVENVISVRYFGVNANWNWTEHSTVTLSAARIVQAVELSQFNVASNEVTLSVSHKFNHLDFM